MLLLRVSPPVSMIFSLVSALLHLQRTNTSHAAQPHELVARRGCRSASPALRMATPVCPRGCVRYLHVPKAGSSFAPMLWAYSCPQVQSRWLELRESSPSSSRRLSTDLNAAERNYRQGRCPCLSTDLRFSYKHQPLMKQRDVRDAVGLFRWPVERVVSAFNYDLHAHRQTEQNASEMRAAVRSKADRANQLITFARWPGVPHVQTKLLLGHHASEDFRPTAASVEKACTVVRHMKFVGLLECFAESTALFKAQFPSRYTGGEADRHYRAGNSSNETVARDADMLLARGYRDEPDERVFCAAAARFGEQLAQHRPQIEVSSRCRAALRLCPQAQPRRATFWAIPAACAAGGGDGLPQRLKCHALHLPRLVVVVAAALTGGVAVLFLAALI